MFGKQKLQITANSIENNLIKYIHWVIIDKKDRSINDLYNR